MAHPPRKSSLGFLGPLGAAVAAITPAWMHRDASALDGARASISTGVARSGRRFLPVEPRRREVMAVDPSAGAFDVMLLTEWTEVTLLPQKAAASLAAGLGLISLLLAAVGLYSVMAYAVTQRTQEIGIRMALGARPLDVLGDILRRGMGLTAIGLAGGLAASFAVTHLIAGMLVNVSATDPATFAGGAMFLAAVAALASYLPARRATKVDPMITLRAE